ncbi:MAG: DNA repair protein, partial [Burkholderiales bacterium PBB4]
MSQVHSLFVQDAHGQYVIADDDLVIASALRVVDSRIPRAQHVFHTPDAVKSFMCLKLGALPYEVFGVLFVNSQNGMIAFDEMFRGTLTQTSVYPREVIKRALDLNAAACVLVHNHPSGQVQPSRADEHLTQTLKTA